MKKMIKYLICLLMVFSFFSVVKALEEEPIDNEEEIIEVIKPEIIINNEKNAIMLSWTEDSNAVKFEVYRSTDKKKYSKIATVETNSYKDKKVTYGKTYYYKVKAIGSANNVTSDVIKNKLVPLTVTSVSLSSIKNDSIKISYEKVNEDGYIIERSTDNKKWKAIKTISKGSTLSYTDKKLKANKTYYYRVRAFKKVKRKLIFGGYSDVVCDKTAPSVPKLTIKTNTYDSLKLTTSTVKGATKYILYRSEKKNGTYESLNEVTPSFVDSELAFGKTYYYKVKACNDSDNCSGYSKVVSAKVVIKKPTIKLKAVKNKPLVITTSNLNNTDGYEIYRSADKKKYSKIPTLHSETLTYEDTKIKKNKKYYYKVKSFKTKDDKKLYSAYSDVKNVKNLYEITTSSFNGIYTYKDVTLKMYALSKSKVNVSFSDPEEGTWQYDLKLKNYELYEKFGESDVPGSVVNIKLTKTGVEVISDEYESGIYTKISSYSAGNFFNDIYPHQDNITTKYNGKFTNSKKETLYLFQYEDDVVFIKASFDKEPLKYLEIKDGSAQITLGKYNYKLTISGKKATLTKYKGKTKIYKKEFSKSSSLSKDKVIEIFGKTYVK